jgi:hypothetical protein
MGLGDHIICHAIVRHLAQDDIVIVPVKRHYESSVKFMYSDDHRIKVVPFANDEDTNRYCNFMASQGLRVIWNGDLGPAHETWERSSSHWDQRFYEQMNLDFNLRWDNFKLPDNSFDWKSLLNKRFRGAEPEDFVFLHYTSSKGEKKIHDDFLQDQYQFVPDINFTDNIFNYVGLLKNAREIHCINSGFLCLADSLNLKGKLHFHASTQDLDFNSPTLRSQWMIHPLSTTVALPNR